MKESFVIISTTQIPLSFTGKLIHRQHFASLDGEPYLCLHAYMTENERWVVFLKESQFQVFPDEDGATTADYLNKKYFVFPNPMFGINNPSVFDYEALYDFCRQGKDRSISNDFVAFLREAGKQLLCETCFMCSDVGDVYRMQRRSFTTEESD